MKKYKNLTVHSLNSLQSNYAIHVLIRVKHTVYTRNLLLFATLDKLFRALAVKRITTLETMIQTQWTQTQALALVLMPHKKEVIEIVEAFYKCLYMTSTSIS